MCGRFALHHATDEVADLFSVDHVAAGLAPRYNIAPSQPVHVVLQHEHRTLEMFRWGLIPFWAKDAKIGNRMINARAETLAEKPAFRAALKRRRCLIPASGFFEWRKSGKDKVPTYIQAPERHPMALAGLWEEWNSPDDELIHSCTIVTTAANDFMAPIHHRMPLILDAEAWEPWLHLGADETEQVQKLLQPSGTLELVSHPVSKMVNAPAHDTPECVAPLAQLDL
jgi:putative SOS response-associated peptidase YedK